MSTILLSSQTTPQTPDTGKLRIFVDSTDQTLKTIDHAGTVAIEIRSRTAGTAVTLQPGTILVIEAI